MAMTAAAVRQGRTGLTGLVAGLHLKELGHQDFDQGGAAGRGGADPDGPPVQPGKWHPAEQEHAAYRPLGTDGQVGQEKIISKGAAILHGGDGAQVRLAPAHQGIELRRGAPHQVEAIFAENVLQGEIDGQDIEIRNAPDSGLGYHGCLPLSRAISGQLSAFSKR